MMIVLKGKVLVLSIKVLLAVSGSSFCLSLVLLLVN